MAKGTLRYTVLALVGEGGFGKVYRARLKGDDAFERDVALKVLHDDHPPPKLLERFRDEARILGLLRDRAIVGVQPPVRIAGRWAVVMDFADGESLAALAAREVVPPGVAVEIVGEVARALDCAYQQAGPDGQPLELIHRDIKPDNVQVTPAGELKLLDFGIAKASFAGRESKTRHGFAGTPGYIAPERTQGIDQPVGDVYSLGVVLHEIVMGIRPAMPATVSFDGEAPTVSADDLEVADPNALDPHLREVLELAAWMRAYEHTSRPSARQVEALCRDLRRRLPGEWLREWAERKVSPRVELPPDERVGQTYDEQDTPGPSQLRADPTPVAPALRPEPPPATERTVMAGVLVSSVFLVGAIFLFGLTALIVAVVLLLPGPPPEAAAPAPPPEPPPVSVAPPPEPPPPAPSMPPPGPTPRPRERVIDTTTGGRADAPDPVPGAAPGVEPPAPERRTGRLLLTTIPSGATVRVSGEVMRGASHTYVLPVGHHTIEIESPAGERHVMPVEIREEQPVAVCYNFDTDAGCTDR